MASTKTVMARTIGHPETMVATRMRMRMAATRTNTKVTKLVNVATAPTTTEMGFTTVMTQGVLLHPIVGGEMRMRAVPTAVVTNDDGCAE